MPKNGDLKIWHISQVPMKVFEVPVPSSPDQIKVAAWMLDTLVKYDLFQYENNVKPDYSNACGLVVYDDGWSEWCEWEDEDGNDIDYYINLYFGSNKEKES